MRATLTLGAETSQPENWRLITRQSNGTTSERTRAGFERSFVFELEPGRYSFGAEARGLASLPVDVEILPGRSTDVTLVLEGLGTLVGAVVDESGAGVAELPLHWRRGPRLERSGVADAFGSYRLLDLVRGAGELVLGDPRCPVVPPRPVELHVGVQDIGSWTLPSLGELELLVLDEDGRPVEDAQLRGTGDKGGAIDAESGFDGRARAGFLPAGMYRVFASSPGLGRGNTLFQFVPGSPASVEVRLRRSGR